MVIVALIWLGAEPDPEAKSKWMSGAKDEWFLSCTFAANPVGDRIVGTPRTSEGLIYKIAVFEFCEEPEGDPVVVPGTGVPFMYTVNWHASR